MKNALIIGINRYNTLESLNGCVNDANEMDRLLHLNQNEKINFRNETITISEKADKLSSQTLNEKCEQLFSSNAQIVLFYFSGHGVPTSDGAMLCTPEYSSVNKTGIEFKYLLKLANESQATNRIIILDCCFAGAAGVLPYRTDEIAIKKGVTILAATRHNQTALDIQGQGLFTSLLIDALEGEAADLRGDISPASIYAHADRSLGWQNQRPLYYANNDQFISLRKVKTSTSAQDIRSISRLFKESNELQLNPSYEPTPPQINPEFPPKKKLTKDFARLQRLNRAGLVEPVGANHMYYAAMKFKSCQLTKKGIHIKRLLIAKLM